MCVRVRVCLSCCFAHTCATSECCCAEARMSSQSQSQSKRQRQRQPKWQSEWRPKSVWPSARTHVAAKVSSRQDTCCAAVARLCSTTQRLTSERASTHSAHVSVSQSVSRSAQAKQSVSHSVSQSADERDTCCARAPIVARRKLHRLLQSPLSLTHSLCRCRCRRRSKSSLKQISQRACVRVNE